MPQQRRYTVKATWQSGETKTLGFVREGRAEAYAAHAHRFGAAVTLTDTETGVVLLEMNGPFPVGLAPERPQQRIESFAWGGPMGGVKRDVFTAGASDFPAEWLTTDGDKRLGGLIRFTGSQPGGTTIGGTSLIYRYTVSGADKASIDTGVDTPNAGSNDWTNGDLLEVYMTIRTDNATASISVDVTLNNDTGNNYIKQLISGSGSTVSASYPAVTAAWAMRTNGNGTAANYAGQTHIVIPDYAGTTWNKSGMFRTGSIDSGAGGTGLDDGLCDYLSTSAVTRLKVAGGGAAKLKVGSQLLIYKRVAS
jgi:hypothetical protein